jgi:hypothetical protein
MPGRLGSGVERGEKRWFWERELEGFTEQIGVSP